MAKSLLVIDDSSTIREAIQLALTGSEWEPVTAANGAEAAEALRQNRVDAILCDVAPGDEDGYELCRSLGASAEGSGVPTLLMGGNVNATAALAVGAAGTLPKPFTAEQVQTTLQEAMEQSDFNFDFDDVPVTAAADAPLELDPMGDGFELQPAGAEGDAGELEEIEVIDLSDDDQFDDLELLDDLEPVELAPVQPTGNEGPADFLDLGDSGGEELPAADPIDVGLDDMMATPPAEEPLVEEEAPLDLDAMLAGAGADVPAEPKADALEEFLRDDEIETSTGAEIPLEEPDVVPMELDAGPPAGSGQEPGAGLTVDGLQLGDDEATPELDDGAPPVVEEPSPGWEEPDVVSVEGAAPDLSGDVEPTLPDPFPAHSAEDTGEEAGGTPANEPSWEGAIPLQDEGDLEVPGPDQDETVAPVELPEEPPFGESPAPATEEDESAVEPVDEAPVWALEPEGTVETGLEQEFETPEEPAAPGDISLDEMLPGGDDGEGPVESEATEDVPLEEPPIEPAPAAGLAALAAAMDGPPQTEDLATTVAAGAGQAVREALQQSLSAEQLGPLVEAAVERVAWEVVPQLAERLIRETIEKLQQEPPSS